MKNKHFLAILVITAAILFIPGLGKMDLTDPDESFYAQTAREMLEEGDWLTPRIFDEPQFEKPPLYYWLVIGSYKAFGVNEFAARFPSALFAMIGVIGVFYLAKLFYGEIAGFFSGLVTATCVQYMALARACVTDMALTVFILLCLVFFMYGWVSEKKRFFYLSSVMAGLAVLTKGPIGLFIPGMTVLLYVAFTRQWKHFSRVPFPLCAFFLLAVSLPWYVLVTRAHGQAFIGEFFGLHNITRFTTPEHRIGSSPFFYIPIVLGGFLPWTLFIPAAISDMRKKGGESIDGIKGKGAFLLIWFLVVFVFFSISKTKLVTYIFPLFPAMAVVMGRFWSRLDLRTVYEDYRLNLEIAYSVLIAAGVGGAIAGPMIFAHEFPGLGITPWILAAEAMFLAGIVLSFALFLQDKVQRAGLAIALSVALAGTVVVVAVLPGMNDYVSSRTLSEKYIELASPGEPLGGECDHRRGIAFYSGKREVVDVHPYHDLKMYMSRPDRVWAIIQVKHYKQLAEDDGAKKPIILVQEAGEYVLITNKAL